ELMNMGFITSLASGLSLKKFKFQVPSHIKAIALLLKRSPGDGTPGTAAGTTWCLKIRSSQYLTAAMVFSLFRSDLLPSNMSLPNCQIVEGMVKRNQAL